jgi:hypothetical protein
MVIYSPVYKVITITARYKSKATLSYHSSYRYGAKAQEGLCAYFDIKVVKKLFFEQKKFIQSTALFLSTQ